jgi:hypothetical protein
MRSRIAVISKLPQIFMLASVMYRARSMETSEENSLQNELRRINEHSAILRLMLMAWCSCMNTAAVGYITIPRT